MNKNKWIISIILISLVFLSITSFSWGMNQIYKGEVVSFFKNVHIPSNTTVRGDIVSIFGDITVEGDVQGDIIAIFGNVDITGRGLRDTVAIFGSVVVEGLVSRDVVAVFGGITVSNTGSIHRDAISILGYGIQDRGSIRRDSVSIMGFMPKGIPPFGVLLFMLAIVSIMSHVFAYLVGVITLLFFNDRFDRMATDINNEVGKKAMIGLLVLLGGMVLSIIFVLTIIGIPLMLVLVPALMLVKFLGNTTIKIAIGRKLAGVMGKTWSPIVELTIGTLLVIVIDFTIIGKLFTYILTLIGVGEVVNSRFGEQKLPPQILTPMNHQKGNDEDA